MTAPAATQPLVIDTGRGAIGADLRVPPAATGLVMFAHGSGSSRFSSRNRAVAAHLEHEGFATLLLDLLTTDEEAIDRVTAQHRFDIPLLAERVVAATDWLATRDDLHDLPLGYFGASTGAAAALIAAAERPVAARAVVSRGGRPDLAGSALGLVEAPTLLIIGSNDEPVIELNQAARDRMTGSAAVEMAIVPGATHLFEEPGTIEQVMALATGWFQRWLAGAA
jgi:pimeloyl-ACP methyl ester carboxylesterase